MQGLVNYGLKAGSSLLPVWGESSFIGTQLCPFKCIIGTTEKLWQQRPTNPQWLLSGPFGVWESRELPVGW